MKYKIDTGQMNFQTAERNANASEFLFFPSAQMAHLQNRTSQPKTKVLQKSHFFSDKYSLRLETINSIAITDKFATHDAYAGF